MVLVNENKNPNVNFSGNGNPTNNLGFKILVSLSSLPDFLKQKMSKGYINFGGNNGGLSSVKKGTISLE